MDVRGHVLDALENARGATISGEKLAKSAGVSRNAVWKAVAALRGEGHTIESGTGAGYRMPHESGVLSAPGICKYLAAGHPFRVETFDCLPSTITAVAERAGRGEAQWLVVAANSQSAGKGRHGRSFYSPPDSGIYFSVLLRPRADMAGPQNITAAAAVAVAEAVEAVSGERAGIKWVNDVLCGGKKVCGILTEASVDMESGGLAYAVLGVGINITQPAGGFAGELNGVAGAVFGSRAAPADVRNRLIADVLTRFEAYYSDQGERRFLPAYRERSVVTGREVEIVSGGGVKRAFALGIDDECRLAVRYEDGSAESLAAGEVRIKLPAKEDRFPVSGGSLQ
jgi:BirA family biotin operon repressor/biotin-[acetyl-CoA-carboxylase] ligase